MATLPLARSCRYARGNAAQRKLQTMDSELTASCAYGNVGMRLTGPPRRVLVVWESSPGYARQFCPRCGSHLVGIQDDEMEVSIGCLDAVGIMKPQYESWVVRREPWLAPLPVPQHDRDEPS
jgi:hypothetical protein